MSKFDSNSNKKKDRKSKSPQAKKIYDFVAEYGPIIDKNMLADDWANQLKPLPSPSAKLDQEKTHLSRHSITEVGRARMIDWIFEVLRAFKMSE